MAKALRLLAAKCPEYASLPESEPDAISPFGVTPVVLSVLDARLREGIWPLKQAL